MLFSFILTVLCYSHGSAKVL